MTLTGELLPLHLLIIRPLLLRPWSSPNLIISFLHCLLLHVLVDFVLHLMEFALALLAIMGLGFLLFLIFRRMPVLVMEEFVGV